MATAKKTETTGPKKVKASHKARSVGEDATPRSTTRKKSLLSRTGDEAKAAAERALLLKTLKAKGWNLTHTAEALEMPGPSQVLRAIDALGLRSEYDAAKE